MNYQTKIAILKTAIPAKPVAPPTKEDFGPWHPDWKMPSKRNAYLIKSLSTMYLDNTVLKPITPKLPQTALGRESVLKAANLPINFGPQHPDWKMPSKRNRYAKLIEEGKI